MKQPEGSCLLPWGGFIENGAGVDAFRVQQIPSCGAGSCSANKIRRTCSNGVLSGSEEYSFGTCYEQGCPSCTLPNGLGTIEHGASVELFSNRTPVCGSSCQRGVRTCNAGTLQGDPSFQWATCEVQNCPCTLPWGGGTVAHGSEIQAYDQGSARCADTCEAHRRTRRCENGTWTEPNTFNRQSCNYTPCSNCSLPWGGSLPHGQTRQGFLQSSVNCGQTCSARDLTCTDGTLAGTPPAPDDTNYRFGSCTVRQCDCELPRANPSDPPQFIQHGGTAVRYRGAVADCPVTCANLRATLSCTNGVLSGADNIPQYVHSSCSAGRVCGCALPWGGSINVGASAYAYRFQSVDCNTSCVSAANRTTLTCVSDGNLQGDTTTFPYGSCSQQPGCSCTLPWGASLEHGQTTYGYRSNLINCSQSCEAERAQFSCSMGVLSGADPGIYRYDSCDVQNCGGSGGQGSGGGEGDGNGRGRNPGGGGGGGGGGPCQGNVYLGRSVYLGCSNTCSIASLWENPPPAPLAPEFGMGGVIAGGSYIPAYTAPSASGGARCENMMTAVYCDCNGQLRRPSGSGTLYHTCVQQ